MDVQDTGVSKFMIDTNGNIGIGTTAPKGKLDVLEEFLPEVMLV